MISDIEIADLLQAQYNGQAEIFDIWSPTTEVSWALKHYDDSTHILFEGSHDKPDWERDFKANMIYVPNLGHVHSGFYSGLTDVLKAVTPALMGGKPISVAGHSLGGGETDIFIVMLLNAGFNIAQGVTFGKPNSGDAELESRISKIKTRSYWNYRNPFHHDLVGDVPFYVAIEPYDTSRKRILIDSPPDAGDEWGLLAWHHFFLYRKGLAAL